MIAALLFALLAADAPKEDPRIAVAQAVIAIREAELDEKTAYAAYLEAQGRKAKAAAALEAAKQKLPGWKPGALLTPDFRIAEDKKQ
jgi:hypothetical protein